MCWTEMSAEGVPTTGEDNVEVSVVSLEASASSKQLSVFWGPDFCPHTGQ